MQTRFLDVNGLRIAYHETDGTGPAIVLVHGNSCSKACFQGQVESALGQRHRIVAIDLPGHGESEDAADPQATYNLPGYAQVVAGVAEQLGLTGAVYVGWSMGGSVVMEASSLLPNPAGLLIFGAPPIGFPPAFDQAFLPNPAMAFAFQPDLTDEQIAAMVAAFLRPGATDIPAFFAADIRRTDGRARQYLGGSIGPGGYTDEVQIVANLTIPLAVLHGAEEQLANLAYISSLAMPTLWHDQVHVVEGAGHAAQVEQPGHFNGLLAAFVNEVAR